MPPVKPSPKAVGKVASSARFINIPRLSTPPNYKQWRVQLLGTNQNKKALATTEKLEIDGLLRRQADQQFKNDGTLLKRAHAGTTTKASIDAWTDAKARAVRFSHNVGAGPIEAGPLADQATKLYVPGVAAHFGNSGGSSA